MAADGLARFRSHFDAECDNCFADIWQDDETAYDKIEGQYICESCISEREEEE